jgi:arabinoxylan arabinofuranohydrolase
VRFTAGTTVTANITVYARWSSSSFVPPSQNDLEPQPPAADIAALFNTANGFPQTLSDARKIWGMNNPSMTFAYVADPVAMVYCPTGLLKNSGDTANHWCDECTLYVYGSNDTLAFTTAGVPISDDFGVVIQGLRVVSTKDLWNWTDHGILNFVGKNSTNPLFATATTKIVPYANDAWTPSAEWKIVNGQPKFFLYWCNSGYNTSVVVSDDGPLGPFYNPGLSQAMINKSMSGFGSVSWLFEPGTMIDDDGTAYMVLGGDGSSANPGNARRVQLGEDMISVVKAEPINLAWHFEGTDIWKWQNRYYVTYTNNWGGSKPAGFGNIDVAYVMNEEGIFGTFPTEVNATPNNPDPNKVNRLMPNGSYGDSTNCASLFDFKGKPYLFYHASSACQAFGATRLRTAHLVDIEVNPDGTLKPVTMGAAGVSQEGDFNPYNVTEAETMAIEGGVYTKGKGNGPTDATPASNGISVASIDTGDWLGLYGVDFDKKAAGATKFNAIVKLPVTTGNEEYVGAIEIRIDPEQQGITNPTNASRLTTGNNQQSRITGGEVVGRVQLKVKNKADEGKWVQVNAALDKTVKGKHNLAFVFYSSKGEALERFTTGPTPANDGRARDVGFEIDQWWFE